KELRPDFAPTRYKLAEAYKCLKRYPEALLEAESVVTLLPRCYQGYKYRGMVWAALGRREAFERDFEQTINLRPNDAEVYNDKASGYRALEDRIGEADAYRKALSFDPDNWLAHLMLSQAYATAGQCDKAFEHYKKAGQRELGTQNAFRQQILDCRARAKQAP
ncbi:MAG: hypothetical protein Q7R41_20725, partial [Phycisphaerales bacterium]|nr:hypothetical protein [Phycisphaerales bacterium]